jgi:hypothetical protein
VFRWRQGMTPVSRPGRSVRPVATGATATVTTPPIQPSPPAQTLEARLAEGRKSQLKSVQQAAKRANEALERFRQVEEERGKAAARAGIARLERELREAKAKLRAKPAVAAPPSKAEPSNQRGNQAVVRAWCVSQGIEVPRMGRLPPLLPREAVEAYEQAHA